MATAAVLREGPKIGTWINMLLFGIFIWQPYWHDIDSAVLGANDSLHLTAMQKIIDEQDIEVLL